jgi:hypothetical protein
MVKLLFQGCHNKINVLVDVIAKLIIKIKIYNNNTYNLGLKDE